MRCGRVRLTLFFPLHNSNFLYQIENVVCYPFRTANLVDNGTKEGQIGEGCWATRPVVNIRQFCFIAPILPLILYCSRAKSLLQQHAHNDIVHQAKCENKDRAKLQSVQRILIKRICLSRKNRTPTPALAKNKDQEEVELKKPK